MKESWKQPPRKGRQYKGISWNKANKRFIAQLHVGKRNVFLGSFKTDIAAAKAYDIGVKTYRGTGAFLNFGGKSARSKS